MTRSACSKPKAANLGGKSKGTGAATKSVAGGGKGERNTVGTAASGKEGAASFAATGRAYVRFALANPAIFRLIFTSSTGSSRRYGKAE